MFLWRSLTIGLCSVLWAASVAFAHEPTAKTPYLEQASVPLYDNLGNHTYPITTANPLAQRYFDQGLRLLYAFNHGEAIRAFHAAQRHDPACAMCYWGEAFALGPNINAPMDDDAVLSAVTALNEAKTLAPRASASEQAMIQALATRYSPNPKADRAALNQAYAEAMLAAAQRFPDNHEIALGTVDAIMNLSPWDYWEADSKTPKGMIGKAIQLTEGILAKNPNHPGAIHLYIHLTEASTTPERAEPYANRLAALMPGAGHMVHMPSHTFYRVGRYHDSAEINKVAAQVDEAYITRANPEGAYAYSYYPHNLHFVLASAQMIGDARTTFEYVQRLEGKIPDAVAEQIAWVQEIKLAPYFAHAQFSTPETILALPDPGNTLPLVKAMWHYARGVAYAMQGQSESAHSEAARIAAINQETDFSALVSGGVPAPDLLRLAHHVVAGRLAQAQGQMERAVQEFQAAVNIQDTLTYMEPPHWYYPVRQSLGATLLTMGKAAEAEQVLQHSLQQFPRNGWALYGLMQAQKAQGKEAQARETEQRFQQAWASGAQAPDLKRL